MELRFEPEAAEELEEVTACFAEQGRRFEAIFDASC
jgi:hypothetical protein